MLSPQRSLLIALICLAQSSWCLQRKINYRVKEKQVLDQILGASSYDARIRPSGINGTDGPAVVRVNIFVRSISKIDDVNMEYSVQLTFREQWLDERLNFNDFNGKIKYLTLTESNRVWMPDLFFSNEKEGHFHNIIMPNVYIRIFPYGSVLYSTRISLTLSCPMNLKLFPHDRQICSLRMASYGWTTDDLVFLWKEGDPVQVVKNLHLPRFTLENVMADYCSSKSIPRINASLPPVSYTKAIDVWTGVCLTFVFGALLEFALVNYASRSDMHRDNMQKQRRQQCELEHAAQLESDLLGDGGATFAMVNRLFSQKPLVRQPGQTLTLDKIRQCEVHMQQPARPNCCRTWLSKFPTRSKRIDVISRITFPLVFALFNLTYWSTYLFREDADG